MGAVVPSGTGRGGPRKPAGRSRPGPKSPQLHLEGSCGELQACEGGWGWCISDGVRASRVRVELAAFWVTAGAWSPQVWVARVAELADALDSGFHFWGLHKVSKAYSFINFSSDNKGFARFLFLAESLRSRFEYCRKYCSNR